MAAKSILEIEVNDQAFQNFMERFKEYEKLLGGLSDEWKAIGASIGGASGVGTKALESTASEIERATIGQQRFARATRSTNTEMHALANNAKQASGYFANIARWTGVGSVLMGGLGAFALDRLANSVFGQRRTALGLGVSTGEQAAFRTNFGQFVDADSLLGNVANARNDLTKQWAFRGLGIGAGDEARMDNADLSADVMRRARQMWRSGPQTAQYAQAMGLSEFFSMEDLRRLGAMSDQDAAQAGSGFSRDRASMAVPDDVQRQWVQFATQLRRAGLQIEATFVRNLAPLTPGLKQLSEGVTRVIESFMGSKGIKEAIDKLGSWISSPELQGAIRGFADWLASPQFTADLREFASDIGLLAKETVGALRWFHLIPDSDEQQAAERKTTEEAAQSPDVIERAQARMKLLGSTPSDDAMKQMFGAAGAKYGVPPELLWNVYGAETDHGKGSLISSKGALGLMQLMPKTAKELGVDPLIPAQAAEGAAHQLSNLYSQYHDWRKAVAAYNWGQGNLDKDISEHGGEWEKFIPKETTQELAKAFPGNGGGTPAQTDLTRAMDKLRRQMASRTTQPQVQVNVSSDVAARVALSGVQAAY